MTQKTHILITLAGTLLLLLLLAAGLSSLELSFGQSFTLRSLPEDIALGEASTIIGNSQLMQAIGLFVAVATAAALIAFIVSPQLRAVDIRRAIVLAFLAFALYQVFSRTGDLEQNFQDMENQLLPEAEAIAPGGLITEPPVWLSTVIAFALITAVGIGIALVVRGWQARQSADDTPGQLEDLALRTIEDLEAGADVRDTVLRCYYDMHDTLARRHDVRYRELLTPREFEAEMARYRVPPEAIHRLTRLFERVRYGGHAAVEAEKDEAIACLRAIVS
ncbi:MAG: DUF4129 domain-containing protein [Chloroflexi bacterium]|nr:DUF4129 domain-containing protein [Chloroflexota bacterium]